MAACARLQRRDAELLKRELNCNMVRCSHYPQSPHFLDACDELGLMVWQETPGWQYIGDSAFRGVVVDNVGDMVIRDRNRPSVIAWGTRLNESRNEPALYADTRAIATALDGSRPCTGAMNRHATEGWAEDLFAYDDYNSSHGDATLEQPIAGIPYMVSEAVGALSGAPLYRWVDSSQTLSLQAQMHAQVHNIARSKSSYAGLLGWAGIDYPSLNGGRRIWRNLKWAGVLDSFRVPKPGAAIYRAQVDPEIRPVIAPAFFWDFGARSARKGPGRRAMIATNCDRLELYLDSEHLVTGYPETRDYGHLAYPPVLVDLIVGRSHRPELRVDGFLGERLVATLRMSADSTRDRLVLTAEDRSIEADGIDMTRVTFRALDAHGNQRPYVKRDVTLSVSGPATLIGENPFRFATYGGVGGAFVRSEPDQTGTVTVIAEHPTLGAASATLRVSAPVGRRFL
jgi:beta-galactosidase